MKKSILIKFLIVSIISLTSFAAKKGVVIDVNLSPAGSFQIQGKVKGSVYEKDGKLISKGLYSIVKKMKTGMDLRDNHTKKTLQYKKYPKVEILKAAAKDGSGNAIIKIRNVKKKVSFKYKRKVQSISKQYLRLV